MANRVTGAEVIEIMDTSLDATTIAPFITAANLTVTNYLGDNTDLDADTLKEIERWLSAHFATIYDPQIKQEKFGDASEAKFVAKAGLGLDATQYGQQVKVLDFTGTLNDVGKPPAEMITLDLDL